MNKCERCGGMHYRTDPCRAKNGETGMVLGTGRERPLSIGLHTDSDPEARFETASLHQKPKHIDRHRKGYFQEYHAKRRAAIKAGTWKPKRKGDGK